MEIIISNKIRIKNCPSPIKNNLIETLKVPNPKYLEAVKNGRWVGNINPHIYNFGILPDDSILIPRGMKPSLFEMVKDHSPTVIDERTSNNFIEIDSSNINYRDYQEKAVVKLCQAEEGLLVAPAGSGKTVIGLSVLPLLGQRCLWLTHTRALAYQALERATKFLPSLGDDDTGIVGDSKWKVGNIFTVGLIPTLVRRPKELSGLCNEFGLVIVDEAHHVPASTFLEVIGALNPYFLYALTATPYRRDKLQALMFQTIGPLVAEITVNEVRSSGGVVMPKIIYRAVHSKPVYGNQIQTILKDLVHNDVRNGLIVGDVLKEAHKGNYCIVLTDRKAHADILYDLIQKGWPKTGIATGKYSKKYVTEQSELLNKKEITTLVCTSALLGEGFDVPFLNRAFIGMPFRAENKAEQIIGRIQRTAEGKDDAVVYDYVDVDIGVLANQFYTKSANNCRCNVYKRLGLEIVPYE
ncbi:MAG: DEAD/DEAH box helicase [Desulfobacteraceae bacterium]